MKKVALIVSLLCISLCSFSLYAQIPSSTSPIIKISGNSAGTLLAISDEKCVTVYDTSDFSPICVFDEPMASKTAFFTENGEEHLSIMTNDGQLSVRNIRRKVTSWYYEPGEPYFSAVLGNSAKSSNIVCSALSDNSDYVAVAFSDNSIKLFFRLRFIKNTIIKSLSKHNARIYGLEFSSSGEYLASVSEDGNAYIWDTYSSVKVASLEGVFTKAKVPVYFTSDTSAIISQDGKSSFRISDITGKTLYSITTNQLITSLQPLKNPDLIAIGNDRKEIVIYSISARKVLSVYEVKRNSLLSAYDFDHKADSIYAGYRDGVVQIVDSRLGIRDNAVKVAKDSEVVADKKSASETTAKAGTQTEAETKSQTETKTETKTEIKKQTGSGDKSKEAKNQQDGMFINYNKAVAALYLGGGYTIITTDNFIGQFDVDFGFQKSFKKLPLFTALDIKVGGAVPKKEFPYDYYTTEGEQKKAPWFYCANPTLTFGYEAYGQKGVRLFVGLCGGGSFRMIWNNSIKENVNSPLHYGGFGGITAGIDLKGFTLKISCVYDTMVGLQNSCSIGATIKFYSRKTGTGGEK